LFECAKAEPLASVVARVAASPYTTRPLASASVNGRNDLEPLDDGRGDQPVEVATRAERAADAREARETAAREAKEEAAEEAAAEQPWKELAQLIDDGGGDPLVQFLDETDSSDIARAVDRLGREHREELLAVLEPHEGADLLEQLSETQGGDLLEAADPEVAAAVLQELTPADQVDLIEQLEPDDAADIIAELPHHVAREAEELGRYAPDSAGRLMDDDYLAFRQDSDAGRVIADLRRRADKVEDDSIQYIYVVDGDGRLTGVLRLRDLLLSPSWRTLEAFMIKGPVAMRIDAPLDELLDLFDGYAFLAVPIVDERGVLRGVVHRSEVQEALSERSARDHRRSQGLIDEELRSMPIVERSKGRLVWLSLNVVLNLAGASVIASHQDTLSAVIALAVFLPIISDMSGCSGHQAVAVSMREISLGITKPSDMLYVLRKEMAVGVINGLVLGLVVAGLAWVWKGNPWLGVVVGSALSINILFAVSIGGTIPLLVKRLGKDPAIASGPILTTLTDMCGFFLVLTLAGALMDKLV
jgi:magnesium transporter